MVFHSSPAEHVAKLGRIVKRMNQQQIHVDDMDDFCKTAWHLVELVERDPTVPRQTKRRASRLRSDPDIAICQLAATIEKHGEAREGVRDRAKVSNVTIQQGYGIGRFGRGDFGIGEQSVVLRFIDGSKRDALEFACTVLAKWKHAFNDAP